MFIVTQVTLKVKGMTCASCVRRVETGLKKIDGVIEANVNLSTEKVTINYDETIIKVNEIINSIDEMGYSAYQANVEKATLPIGGMTCASCVRRIEIGIKKIAGVSSVSVNLATEKVTVEYDNDVISLADIKSAIVDLGYQVFEGTKETSEDREKLEREREMKKLRLDFLLAAVLTTIVLIGSLPDMVEGWGIFSIANDKIYTNHSCSVYIRMEVLQRSLCSLISWH